VKVEKITQFSCNLYF